MAQKRQLRELIEIHHLFGYFKLGDLYKTIERTNPPVFTKPEWKASTRAYLQDLRDEGFLIFVDRGIYKVKSYENKYVEEFIKELNNGQWDNNLIERILSYLKNNPINFTGQKFDRIADDYDFRTKFKTCGRASLMNISNCWMKKYQNRFGPIIKKSNNNNFELTEKWISILKYCNF